MIGERLARELCFGTMTELNELSISMSSQAMSASNIYKPNLERLKST